MIVYSFPRHHSLKRTQRTKERCTEYRNACIRKISFEKQNQINPNEREKEHVGDLLGSVRFDWFTFNAQRTPNSRRQQEYHAHRTHKQAQAQTLHDPCELHILHCARTHTHSGLHAALEHSHGCISVRTSDCNAHCMQVETH